MNVSHKSERCSRDFRPIWGRIFLVLLFLPLQYHNIFADFFLKMSEYTKVIVTATVMSKCAPVTYRWGHQLCYYVVVLCYEYEGFQTCTTYINKSYALHQEIVWAVVLGPVSISVKTSYCKISQNLEAMWFVFRIVRSLWNLIGTSAAAELPVKFQSNTII